MLIKDVDTINLQNALSDSRLNLVVFLEDRELNLDKYKYELNQLYYGFVKEVRNNLLNLHLCEGETIYLQSLLSAFELLDYQLKESLFSQQEKLRSDNNKIDQDEEKRIYPSEYISQHLYFFLHQKHIIQNSIDFVKGLSKRCTCLPNKNASEKVSWQDEIKNFYPEITRIKGELSHLPYIHERITFLQEERKFLAEKFLKEGRDLYASPINFFFESRLECLREVFLLNKKNSQSNVAECTNIEIPNQSVNTLKWTTSKTSLVELIYGLYHLGVINNGEASIQEITTGLEELFGVTLADVYHTYSEIRGRKIERTKFLDQMRDVLKNKMFELDEKM